MFLQGLQRILNCSKVQVAATGLASTWLAVHYAASDLPPTQRSAMWIAFIGAVAVQLREIINAWTEEDVARLSNGAQSRLPDARTRRHGDAETNALTERAAPLIPASPCPPVFASVNSGQKVSNVPVNPRNPTMPPRTKFPLILFAFTSIALLAGCQTCPELAIYREGLHRIDEPLYQCICC